MVLMFRAKRAKRKSGRAGSVGPRMADRIPPLLPAGEGLCLATSFRADMTGDFGVATVMNDARTRTRTTVGAWAED